MSGQIVLVESEVVADLVDHGVVDLADQLGAVVAAAERSGMSVPLNMALLALVRGVERGP